MQFNLGDIVVLDDEPCVVVGLSGQLLGDEEVPEEHIAVWFGGNNPKRWDSGYEQVKGRIEVWTIPAAYFNLGPTPIVSH
ncbi:hypothetical protein [Hymenobacter fodinae]|uniref:DUF2158 domain-containing protein n=1 Tax=Hymenobacter fodinae TaxID=2510796 RepID=A0A4Z0PDQ5_9BACT|nr:hypothetical protein [Hymenobacter fodinae]TGE09769.1 hypothetical protein EU556_02760 [Hymenobacter fodinae]